MTDFSIL